jgi:pimeloyl-ACP methyl ester carboxylesterase
MLVHGWEGRGSQLGAVVEPLVGAGMSVVAFDAPGHGDSPGDQLYLADLADCVSEVAARVGPHAIFAHSFGCAAVLLAHRRGGVDAARNVFVSPNAVVADAVRSFARAISLDDADRVAFQARVEARGGVPFAALGLDWLAGGRDAGLLVIHDRSDREVPLSHAERLVAAWPGAQLVTTDGLGHRKILRDPAVLAAATTFCAQGAPAPGSELPRLLGPELERIAAS